MNKEAAMMNGGYDHDHDQDQELLQAQAHIWNHIFSFINSMSLKCAVELGIPDVIHSLHLHSGGKPSTVSELIDALKIDKAKAPFLSRLMRILTHSGFFLRTKKINVGGNDEKEEEEEEEEAYVLTSSSKLLLKENPLSLSPFLHALLDPIMTEPWHRLSDWFRSHDDTSPFVTNHGKEFWEMAGQQPRFNNFFNEAMASDARLVSSLITGNNNNKKVFEGLSSLVDVGGGTGNMSKAIAKAFPEMKCTVMDLPHVVQGLKGTKNLSYVGGDMFESIPPAHAILLKNVLHGWSDEESVKILKKCKEAIPSKEKGGKVIIVDMVLAEDTQKITQAQLCSDMFMMVLVTGRERQEKDWKKLFYKAGFSDYKITPTLGLRSLIELYY